MIMFDCPPAIGYQSMNAVFAADMLYIPSGLGYWDYVSTISFIGQLAESLDGIRATALTRDRAIGLSNPIRVVARDDGFDLVQRYRRLAAYLELLAETSDIESWGRIPTGLISAGGSIDALYRCMVDENMPRRDISFAEMEELARAYTTHAETGATRWMRRSPRFMCPRTGKNASISGILCRCWMRWAQICRTHLQFRKPVSSAVSFKTSRMPFRLLPAVRDARPSRRRQ